MSAGFTLTHLEACTPSYKQSLQPCFTAGFTKEQQDTRCLQMPLFSFLWASLKLYVVSLWLALVTVYSFSFIHLQRTHHLSLHFAILPRGDSRAWVASASGSTAQDPLRSAGRLWCSAKCPVRDRTPHKPREPAGHETCWLHSLIVFNDFLHRGSASVHMSLKSHYYSKIYLWFVNNFLASQLKTGEHALTHERHLPSLLLDRFGKKMPHEMLSDMESWPWLAMWALHWSPS